MAAPCVVEAAALSEAKRPVITARGAEKRLRSVLALADGERDRWMFHPQ
jgi:hypothetical protein